MNREIANFDPLQNQNPYTDLIKFVTIDLVGEVTQHAKFSANRSRELPDMIKI